MSSEETVQSKHVTTLAVGLKFGLFLAAFSVVYFFASSMARWDVTQGTGRWLGILANAVLVFLAHKFFKDRGNSYMSYGESFSIGFWMASVSSVISGVFTYIYVKYIDTDFIGFILAQQEKMMVEKGVPEEYAEKSLEMTERFMTPGSMMFFGLVGNMLMLLIVTAIVGIFTQKKNPSPFT